MAAAEDKRERRECVSWLYSRALVEEYSAAHSSDGKPCAPSNSTPTPQAYCAPDRMTAFSRPSRFGMTLAPLTEDRGAELLMWYQAAFRVRTSAQPARVQGSTESEAGSGERWPEWFARWDRDTCSWRTPQCSLFAGSTEFSENWPRSGTMRNGACSERSTPGLHTSASESGLLPTPCTVDSGSMFNRSASAGAAIRPTLGAMARHGLWPTPRSTDGSHGGRVTPRKSRNGGNLIEAVPKETFPTPTQRDWKSGTGADHGEHSPPLSSAIGGQLNPTFVEWLMGWNYGWTSLDKGRIPFSREEITFGCLRTMWFDHEFTGSPSGREFVEQLTRERPDTVRLLSHDAALEDWKDSVEEVSDILCGLWKACNSWPLRNAQESFQEAWKRTPTEAKGWVALAALRGIWHAEWPGVPRVSTGIAARVDRLKAIGNGQVPAVAALAWTILKARAAEEEVGNGQHRMQQR